MSPYTTPKFRRVSYLPCCGTGEEIKGAAPGDNLTMGACFWCDGHGFVMQPTDPDPRPRCSACRRPTIDYAGISVCPTCTSYDAADFED